MSKRKIPPFPNGRSVSKGPGFSRVPVEMQGTLAFQNLTASALRVLLYCLRLSYGAATDPKRPKGSTERPTFPFTNQMARDILDMSPQTFSRAKKELAEKGFIEWAVRGGLRGCNGVASRFSLSSRYRDWTPPAKPRNHVGLEKARAALKKQGHDQ